MNNKQLEIELVEAIENRDKFIFSKERYTQWGKIHLTHLQAKVRSKRLKLAKSKGTHTYEQWLSILEEFDYRCVKCGCIHVGMPCKDHINPISQGGSDGVDNIQPLCRECNTSKGLDDFNWANFRRQKGF